MLISAVDLLVLSLYSSQKGEGKKMKPLFKVRKTVVQDSILSTKIIAFTYSFLCLRFAVVLD